MKPPGVVCSLSLLIRGAQRARCQAETPLIVLFRFLRPALCAPIGGPRKTLHGTAFQRSFSICSQTTAQSLKAGGTNERRLNIYMPRGLKKACLGAWLVFTKAFLRMVSRWMTPVFCQRNKNRLDKPRDETEAWLY